MLAQLKKKGRKKRTNKRRKEGEKAGRLGLGKRKVRTWLLKW